MLTGECKQKENQAKHYCSNFSGTSQGNFTSFPAINLALGDPHMTNLKRKMAYTNTNTPLITQFLCIFKEEQRQCLTKGLCISLTEIPFYGQEVEEATKAKGNVIFHLPLKGSYNEIATSASQN